MPNLLAYAKRLYAMFGDTVDWDHIKRHYCVTHHQSGASRNVGWVMVQVRMGGSVAKLVLGLARALRQRM